MKPRASWLVSLRWTTIVTSPIKEVSDNFDRRFGVLVGGTQTCTCTHRIPGEGSGGSLRRVVEDPMCVIQTSKPYEVRYHHVSGPKQLGIGPLKHDLSPL